MATDSGKTRLYRISEAAEALALSKATLYREVAKGSLKAVKIGSATRFTSQELDRYVATLDEAAHG